MNNAELMVRLLEKAGVHWVFGVPSGPVLPLMEALHQSGRVEFVLTATETSAAFMAETVGRLTGVPGVCVSTIGPGATNLATGVGGAWLDRSPLIAITCTYPARWLGRRTQMLIDHQALFKPLTKASFRLETGNVAGALAEAMALARGEPPGPVHLELPEDVAQAEADQQQTESPPPKSPPEPMEGLGAHVLAALRRSKRPLVVTGLTFTRSTAPDLLLHFIERQQVPFVTTLHAKGFLPESHPNSLGVMGRARRTDVQKAIARADLILAVGFDPIEINYEEWVGDTPVVHLSTEAADVDESVAIVLDAVGNLDAIVEELSSLPRVPNEWSNDDWAQHRALLRTALRPSSLGLATHQVLDLLAAKLPPDAILAYDVGAHTHQIATQWQTDLPHTCLSTNGWSSMGYGMPAAYAAKLVHRQRTVVGVVGDGCFQMTVGELATARRLGLSVPIIVLNDGWLGLMKVKQERLHYSTYGTFLGDQVDSPPHYFGVPCRAVRNLEALDEALAWALGLEGPSVIETFVDVEPYSFTVHDE